MVVTGSHWVAVGPADEGFTTTDSSEFVVGAVLHGSDAGARALCTSFNGDGFTGTGAGTAGAGVRGISETLQGNGVIADAHNGDQAYGLWARSRTGFAGRFHGKVYIEGNLQVTGTKSAAVAMPDGSRRLLYALESPESWFEDFGFGWLVDGRATITLDPDFMAVVSDGPYHVFVTEYEGSNGLYVAGRTATGFEVHAKDPEVATEFSYRVVAKRADVPSARLEALPPDHGQKDPDQIERA